MQKRITFFKYINLWKAVSLHRLPVPLLWSMILRSIEMTTSRWDRTSWRPSLHTSSPAMVGIVGGGVGGWTPQFMSTDAHFWVKIGFKLQSLGKISNISAADLPPPSSFRSIPTLSPASPSKRPPIGIKACCPVVSDEAATWSVITATRPSQVFLRISYSGFSQSWTQPPGWCSHSDFRTITRQ